MATLRRCKAEVTFQCPNWNKCNEMLYGGMHAGRNTCRFCVSRGKNTMCLLHNKQLLVDRDGTVLKCKECNGKTTNIFGPKVTQVDLTEVDTKPDVDVKQIIRKTADMMQKTINQLERDGYPREMSLKLAYDLIVKGGW